jgi:hypothetical protein
MVEPLLGRYCLPPDFESGVLGTAAVSMLPAGLSSDLMRSRSISGGRPRAPRPAAAGGH